MRMVLLALLMVFGPDAWLERPATIVAIDGERSLAQFTVTKLGFADVTGRFTRMDGEVHWHPDAPEAGYVRWRIDAASVETDDVKRDETLSAPEYFDVARHPWLTFESTDVARAGPQALTVTGRLTMRGTTRPLIVTVRHSGPADAPVFETAFEVDRYDFGIVGGRVMSRLIGRTVRIQLRAVTKEVSP